MSGPHPSRDSGAICKDCSAAPLPGERRCKVCKAAHNGRERARRAERKRREQCRVCGRKAATDAAGAVLSTCKIHRQYYAARARAAAAAR